MLQENGDGCDRQLNVGARHRSIIGSDDGVIIAVPRPLGDGNADAIARLRDKMRSPVLFHLGAGHGDINIFGYSCDFADAVPLLSMRDRLFSVRDAIVPLLQETGGGCDRAQGNF